MKSFAQPATLIRAFIPFSFSTFLCLQPGEAIFQDAGIPHAYMQGQNMELMANSDNVLRGGLTPKHIDVPELLKHIDFKATIPEILTGKTQNESTERVYQTSAPDFQLSLIELDSEKTYQMASSSLEILFVYRGEVTIKSSIHINASKGETIAITAGTEYKITTQQDATIYKASCPVK